MTKDKLLIAIENYNRGLTNISDVEFIIDKYSSTLLQQTPDVKNVTRVDVIDKNGRAYANWNIDNKVELQLQDQGRTLKVFIKNKI